MSETIITKTCSRCKQSKPVGCFGKNRFNKDGYQYYCKPCYKAYHKKYHKTEKRANWLKIYAGNKKYKKMRHKHEHSEKYIQQRNEYQKTDQFKTSIRKYQQSDKGKLQTKKDHEKYPKRRKARITVANALATNKLIRPSGFYCKCGNRAQEYHHHLGYAPEHWLAVIPLCLVCHRSIHNK